MNRQRRVNGWAISFALRRYHAQQDFKDLLLFPIVRTTENVNCPPVERLPFNPPNKPELKDVGLFTWKRGLCAFEKGVERIFIYTPNGLPVDTAEDEIEADDKVYRLNNCVRDAGIQRFAVGRKFKVVS